MDSPRCLDHLGLGHIDFAYVDAMHDYPSVWGELRYIADRQRVGDLILLDDAGPLYPGVERAIEEAKSKIGYVELVRIQSVHRPQPWVLLRKIRD